MIRPMRVRGEEREVIRRRISNNISISTVQQLITGMLFTLRLYDTE